MEALSCDGYICGIRNILIRNPGRGLSRPLKCMEISENKFRSTEHGSIELRWLYMWDPEYSDSELSGKSRDDMCPYTRTNSQVRRRV